MTPTPTSALVIIFTSLAPSPIARIVPWSWLFINETISLFWCGVTLAHITLWHFVASLKNLLERLLEVIRDNSLDETINEYLDLDEDAELRNCDRSKLISAIEEFSGISNTEAVLSKIFVVEINLQL